MAHHKAGGSTKNGRDSAGRRLGIKVCGGGRITKGAIIVRQRGTHYFPKNNVDMGKDQTIFDLIYGIKKKKKTKENRVLVSVEGR